MTASFRLCHRVPLRQVLILLLMLISCSERSSLKVFDVHLHGDPDVHVQLNTLEENGVYKAAVSTSWKLQQSYTSKKSFDILQGLMFPCPNGRVPYSQQPCFDGGEEWPSIEWVESLMKDGRLAFLGEVLTQYYGISSSDTLMYPYYSLAEKYGVPVGIHTGSAGPDHGCPDFKEHLGNPMLLKPMLDRFTKLKVWLMHAGLPFYDETVRVMKDYPNLYVDISAINNPQIVNPEMFSKTIKSLIDQGFGSRIMFGSDNGDIRIAIRSITSLPFLSQEQKEDILHKNAERFFLVR